MSLCSRTTKCDISHDECKPEGGADGGSVSRGLWSAIGNQSKQSDTTGRRGYAATCFNDNVRTAIIQACNRIDAYDVHADQQRVGMSDHCKRCLIITGMGLRLKAVAS